MAAPHLNRALVLEAPDRTPDGAGGYLESWSVLGTLWAEITPRSGRERRNGAASVSVVPVRIVVRGAPHGARARPRAGQRLRDGDRVFAITAVAEHDAQGRYLLCFADEEVAP